MQKQIGSVLMALVTTTLPFQLFASDRTLDNFDRAVERNRELPSHLENTTDGNPTAARGIGYLGAATLVTGIVILVGAGIAYGVCDGDQEICDPAPGCDDASPATITLGALATAASDTISGCLQELADSASGSGSGSGDDYGSGSPSQLVCHTEDGCRKDAVIALGVGGGLAGMGTLLWMVPHLAKKLARQEDTAETAGTTTEAGMRRTTSGPLRFTDITEI